MNIKDFKELIDLELGKYIDNKLNSYSYLENRTRIKENNEYIKKYIFSGGKRIRPYLCYLGYKANGGKSEEIIKLSLAFELYHVFALIHDDIIDNGTIRHNIDTYHIHIGKKINSDQYGRSQAMLIGDLIFARAYEIAGYKYTSFEDRNEAIKSNIQTMLEEVILGQCMDVEMMYGLTPDEDQLDIKNHFKTASYTFIRPITTGVIASGASKETISQYEELGKHLGLTFQIRDDLIDIIIEKGDKTIFSDIQDGQPTIFSHFLYNNGTQEQKNFLKECFGNKLSEQQISKLREIFHDSGAIQYGKDKMKHHIEESEKILGSMTIVDEKYRIYFNEIIELLKNIK